MLWIFPVSRKYFSANLKTGDQIQGIWVVLNNEVLFPVSWQDGMGEISMKNWNTLHVSGDETPLPASWRLS